MGYYNHSLSLDATIVVSKSCPIIGEQIVLINVLKILGGSFMFRIVSYFIYVAFYPAKAIPFFFVYCRMRFLILGRSVGKRKKKRKNKIGKLSGARRPGTSASYPWSLKTTRCGYKVNKEGKIDFVVRIREKAKNL